MLQFAVRRHCGPRTEFWGSNPRFSIVSSLTLLAMTREFFFRLLAFFLMTLNLFLRFYFLIVCFVACAPRNYGEVFSGRVFSAWIFVSGVFVVSAAFFKISGFEVFFLKNKIFSRFSFCVFKTKVLRGSDFCAFCFLWLFGQFFFLYSKSCVSGCVPRPVQCGSN